MRTLFEDTNLKTELEEVASRGKEGKYTLLGLWLIAIVFLAGVWGTYRWADSRPAVEPPPPRVSVDDPKQTAEAFGKFSQLVVTGNWAEAENMLSTAAKQKLSSEQKSLRDSLLGDLKDLKISTASPTTSVDRSIPGRVRQDFYYVFTDEQFTKTVDKIIPLVLMVENDRLVIDSWSDMKPEDQKKTEGEGKPAEKQ